METELKYFFKQYGSISEEALVDIIRRLKVKTIEKGERLLSPGKICRHVFFVVKGCLRLYYISNDVETTVWFSFENNSAIELSSFLSEEPSEYFIEAIETSELLLLHKSDLIDLFRIHPELEGLIRVFWEDVILNLLRRFTALQKDSAEKRYLDLMKQPNYLQRVPQKYLASFIGVTPTSLSRIRRKIK